MKAIILAIALSLSANMNAEARGKYSASQEERFCLGDSQFAGAVAKIHLSNKDFTLEDALSSKDNTEKHKAIISYIFIMDLNEVDARRLVYLKCKSGEYEH